jgi:hypothetical protein
MQGRSGAPSARHADHASDEQREASSATRRAGQLREERGDTVAAARTGTHVMRDANRQGVTNQPFEMR